MFYIYAFFAQFPLFPYNPFRPFVEEFHRMCVWFGWNSANRLLVYDSFHQAIITQFNATYGADVNNLASWQLLCIVLRINPVPADLKTCRKRVLAIYVNIFDLLAFPIFGPPQMFPTEAALSEYSLKNRKVFPRECVEPDSLLSALLRRIYHPKPELKRKGGR
ncbi:hypothetical protein LXA43DRAFT_296360 [Ganoderma leucocontextum]|nr:hypothetical protein LXA43DRAFT_296360 [Ganoderma leucocontextum]